MNKSKFVPVNNEHDLVNKVSKGDIVIVEHGNESITERMVCSGIEGGDVLFARRTRTGKTNTVIVYQSPLKELKYDGHIILEGEYASPFPIKGVVDGIYKEMQQLALNAEKMSLISKHM